MTHTLAPACLEQLLRPIVECLRQVAHQRMRDLKKLERVLTELAARCHGKKVPDCPILDALNG